MKKRNLLSRTALQNKRISFDHHFSFRHNCVKSPTKLRFSSFTLRFVSFSYFFAPYYKSIKNDTPGSKKQIRLKSKLYFYQKSYNFIFITAKNMSIKKLIYGTFFLNLQYH